MPKTTARSIQPYRYSTATPPLKSLTFWPIVGQPSEVVPFLLLEQRCGMACQAMLRRPRRCRCSRTGWRHTCSVAATKLFDSELHFFFLVIISPQNSGPCNSFHCLATLKMSMMMMMMMIQHGCRLIQRTRRLTEEHKTTAYAALSQFRAVKTCDRISHF